MAVSVRRERLDDGKEKDGMQFNYRVTFRTSQVKCNTPACTPSALLLVLGERCALRNAWRERGA